METALLAGGLLLAFLAFRARPAEAAAPSAETEAAREEPEAGYSALGEVVLDVLAEAGPPVVAEAAEFFSDPVSGIVEGVTAFVEGWTDEPAPYAELGWVKEFKAVWRREPEDWSEYQAWQWGYIEPSPQPLTWERILAVFS